MKKVFNFAVKKAQNHFLSQKFCKETHIRDMKIFWPVTVLKLRKGQNI